MGNLLAQNLKNENVKLNLLIHKKAATANLNEKEKLLFEYTEHHSFEPVSLRVGMVYGEGILMIDAAQWFAQHYMLGVWKKDTHIHLNL